MGLVTGFISTSMALISAQTEKATAGKTLGTMQMSNVAGGLFGPLMGGFMADSVGFIYTFFLTAAVIYVSAIVIIFGVKEQPIRSKEAKRVSYSRKDVLFHIFKQPLLVVTMLLTFITQVGNFSIQPLLALYIHDLHGPVNLAFMRGLLFLQLDSAICCLRENGEISEIELVMTRCCLPFSSSPLFYSSRKRWRIRTSC